MLRAENLEDRHVQKQKKKHPPEENSCQYLSVNRPSVSPVHIFTYSPCTCDNEVMQCGLFGTASFPPLAPLFANMSFSQINKFCSTL